jgi:hypothetical protein
MGTADEHFTYSAPLTCVAVILVAQTCIIESREMLVQSQTFFSR